MTWWWPYLLSSVGALGLWGVGKYFTWGFAVLVFSECLWVIYAIVTRQIGFIPFSFLWMGLYARGWYHSSNKVKLSGFQQSKNNA